jgi:hypothetical protein
MDLTPYLEGLRADLAAVAAPAGPETVRAAGLLGGALESSARLALLEALSDAAAEITTRLSGPVVEVRLRGRDAELVVTGATPPVSPVPPPPAAYADTGGDLARVTLRMPESLKTHVEQTAAAEGVSVNAWLVRAVTTAISAAGGAAAPPGRRVTGFFQA